MNKKRLIIFLGLFAFLVLPFISAGNIIVKNGELNVSEGIIGWDDLNVTGNITLGQKITFAFAETIDNIIDGWIRIIGGLNVTGNITAPYFIGDGSLLSNVNGSGIYVPYTGATSNVDLGDNNFLINNSVFFVNSTSGNVGIGTTAPGAPFDVIGDVRLKPKSGVAPRLHIYNADLTDEALIRYLGSGSASALSFEPHGVEKMRIQYNGNVGINTTSPQAKLHVEGNGTTSAFFMNGNVGIGTTAPGRRLHVYHPTADNVMTIESGDSKAGIVLKDNAGIAGIQNIGNDLQFVTSDSENVRMYINATDGKVGIGTTEPGAKLDVNGGDLKINNIGAGWLKILQGYDTTYSSTIYQGSAALEFGTADSDTHTPRMVIKSNDGNVGINTTSPQAKLHVEGNGTTSAFFMNGNVGIGTTNPGYRLQVGNTTNYGWVATTGAWATDSDLRLKTNIENITNALDIVTSLRGVRFNKITDSENQSKQIGFIAQEIEVQIPEMVSTGEDGMKGLSYSKITPVLLEAIKELKAENNFLKLQNQEILDRLEVLEKS